MKTKHYFKMTLTLKTLLTTHALSMVRIEYCLKWPSLSKRLCNIQYPQHKKDEAFSQSDSHVQSVCNIPHPKHSDNIVRNEKKQGHLFHKIA